MGIFQHLPIKYIGKTWELIDPLAHMKSPPYQSSCKVMALAMVTPSLTIWGTWQAGRGGWHGGLKRKSGLVAPTDRAHYISNPKNKAISFRDKSSNFDHHPKKTLVPHWHDPKRPGPVHPNVIIESRDPTTTQGLEGFPLQHHVAALRAQSHLDRIGHGIDATLKPRLQRKFHCHLFCPTKMVHHWNFSSTPTKNQGKTKPTKNDYREIFLGICNTNVSTKDSPFVTNEKTWNTTNWYSPRHIPNKIWSRYFCCPASLKEIFLAAWQLGTVGWAGIRKGRRMSWNEGRIWQERWTECSISMAATTFENGSKP